MHHTQFRSKVVDHLEQEKCKYLYYMDEDIRGHIREQIIADGRESSWATETEVIAAADLYMTNIAVTQQLDENPEWHVFKPVSCLIDDNLTIYLLLKLPQWLRGRASAL